ncbi:MAG: serine/threonine protein kinase [Planctomycetes bacterium]|nr:serine/threonine protein kinase [Planctomycetota bacterium]
MQLTRLGPYEIDKPLGKGGMGSVYAATDTQSGQRVAIKALTPHLAMAEGFRERFEAEIESLKALRHEGIVRLYGYGEQDGVLFYSMELVDGISLEDELKAGRRFSWREVTNIAIQLALALKHAHDHGIVHRDIKPANILLAGDDHVKLADFGIARLFGNTQLTTAGGVLGTADYMSPEQAEGRPVTARCDQYSLGGVMYALLAGRPPFLAKNLPQILQLQRFANPEPVRRYAPDTPEQLERVISQLLAKDPADRFPNTQVLARHLQAMVIALSRPAADDFALAGEHSPDPHLDSGIAKLHAIEAAQVEGPARSKSVAPADARSGLPPGMATQDAATLAAEDAGVSRQTGGKAPALAAAADGAATQVLERPTRFTTIEEEEARLQAQHQRSWLLIVGQLAALAAVLGGMGAFAVYLSRPPSADELYTIVSDRGDGDDGASLGSVEREINKFLALYPDDPRADKLHRYKQQIELDKLERQLRRQARDSGSADPSLLPAEQLYLRAADLANSSPDEAVTMFQALVDLYGPTAPGKADNDVSAIVELAKQRLASLRADLTKSHERQLAALRERLDVAEKLSKTNPQQASAMYRAIIELYQSNDWAHEIVEPARNRLEELNKE